MRHALTSYAALALLAFGLTACGSSGSSAGSSGGGGGGGPALPSVASVDAAVLPIGSHFEIQGANLAGATAVSIGGLAQTAITVLSDAAVRVDQLAGGTPVGAQPLTLTTPNGTSVAIQVEVVALAIDPPILAHGCAPRLMQMGLTGGFGNVSAAMAGTQLSVAGTQPTQFDITLIPDGVPTDWQDLHIVSGGRTFAPLPVRVIHMLLNELDSDQTGLDTGEFVEISTGFPGLQLQGYVLVLFNGSDDQSYDAYDLGTTGNDHTNPDGMFVVGNATLIPPPKTGNSWGSSSLQNGADAVALYQGSKAEFPNDTAITTLRLIDAVVYDSNDADDAGLLAPLFGVGPEAAQVNEGGDGSATSDSVIRTGTARLDGRAWGVGIPTPWLPNKPKP